VVAGISVIGMLVAAASVIGGFGLLAILGAALGTS
jgi:hypothetical protein